MKRDIYHIIEVANTHGGDIEYVHALIDIFSEYQKGFGMKFQPFKYDRIASKDFSWYETYKELYFNPEQWGEIIAHVRKTKDVWLDMFDTYSVEVLSTNLTDIHGIKLQASVLYNFEMLDALSELDLSTIKLQVNIAGYGIEEIKTILERLKEKLQPGNLVLQFGFQAYPTEFNDAGLSKITRLKQHFPEYDLCFADHLDGTTEEALIMPLVAVQAGCWYIEKHVYHDKRETRFDQFSSLDYEQYGKMVKRISAYQGAFKEEFINQREAEYLRRSMQIPILNKDKNAGDLVSLKNDVYFKRTSNPGINVRELIDIQSGNHVLTAAKAKGDTLSREDFRKAKLATIVACRMKSSRLPKKAIQKIGDLSSIELCLKNLLEFDHVDYTILATSTEAEDEILKNYTYSDTVIFHQGDPDDVIERYLEIIDKLEIDIVIRVTGDCPYVSKDTNKLLLESHLENGADYTRAVETCIGMNGEIYNANVLRTIKQYFPNADYSEYMSYYVTNNPSYFNINSVRLPDKYSRNYRITLDYQEDLDFLNKIDAYFRENNIDYSVDALMDLLDNNPELAATNQHCSVVYHENHELIKRISSATTIPPQE